jgi:hypothetical protein
MTGKNRYNRCLSGCNKGTTLAGKQKIGAKLCCILLSFFLGYQLLLGTKARSALDFRELQRGCFLEQNCVLLLILESFGGVASWKKNAFHSGLRRALERLLLQTKIAFRSTGLWRREFWQEIFHR